jgi:hypothetical protein
MPCLKVGIPYSVNNMAGCPFAMPCLNVWIPSFKNMAWKHSFILYNYLYAIFSNFISCHVLKVQTGFMSFVDTKHYRLLHSSLITMSDRHICSEWWASTWCIGIFLLVDAFLLFTSSFKYWDIVWIVYWTVIQLVFLLHQLTFLYWIVLSYLFES